MELTANAKINLTLDILRRREDGYHDMRMVMQAVTLADILTVVPAQGAEGAAVSNLRFLPTGGKNLAQTAAAAFRAAAGTGGEVDVSIQKHIPVCAGLAGGSADAAAVLRAMNALTGAGLSLARLAEIGARVGSDVPFCVLGGTALAEGRGERLTDLPALPPCWLAVCKPPCSISTPELFSLVRLKKLRCHPDTAGMTAALAAGSGVLGSSAFGWPQAVSVSAMLNVRPYISAFLMVCSSFVRFLNGSAPGVGPSRQNTQEIFSTYHYFFNLSPGCFKIKAVWKDRGIVYFSTCRRHDVKIRAYTGNVK